MTTSRHRPQFDPNNPWLVTVSRVIDASTDLSVYTQHCCERSAEEHARYLRAMGTLNVSVEEQRPVPHNGMGGGWRVSPGAKAKHVCALAPRVEEVADLGLSQSEMRLITFADD